MQLKNFASSIVDVQTQICKLLSINTCTARFKDRRNYPTYEPKNGEIRLENDQTILSMDKTCIIWAYF